MGFLNWPEHSNITSIGLKKEALCFFLSLATVLCHMCHLHRLRSSQGSFLDSRCWWGCPPPLPVWRPDSAGFSPPGSLYTPHPEQAHSQRWRKKNHPDTGSLGAPMFTTWNPNTRFYPLPTTSPVCWLGLWSHWKLPKGRRPLEASLPHMKEMNQAHTYLLWQHIPPVLFPTWVLSGLCDSWFSQGFPSKVLPWGVSCKGLLSFLC